MRAKVKQFFFTKMLVTMKKNWIVRNYKTPYMKIHAYLKKSINPNVKYVFNLCSEFYAFFYDLILILLKKKCKKEGMKYKIKCNYTANN